MKGSKVVTLHSSEKLSTVQCTAVLSQDREVGIRRGVGNTIRVRKKGRLELMNG